MMKKLFAVFSLSMAVTSQGYTATHHFTLQEKGCYTAPENCLIVVKPSKWGQKPRMYDIEKVCVRPPFPSEGLTHDNSIIPWSLYKSPIQTQVAKQRFLGNKICNGVVTISDMNLPFLKDYRHIADANDGIELIKTADNSLRKISDLLQKLLSIAQNARSHPYSAAELTKMNEEYFEILNKITGLIYQSNLGQRSLLEQWEYLLIPIHHNQEEFKIRTMHADFAFRNALQTSTDIMSYEHAQMALPIIREAIGHVNAQLRYFAEDREKLEAIAKEDATITTIDLNGPQIIVKQESAA